MASCAGLCACGLTCCRRDEHSDLHVCANGFGCMTRCPKCGHHGLGHRREENEGFRCCERMSYDNNDFCHCKHGAPEEAGVVGSLGMSFYAVRNSEGKWFRAKGRSGLGKSWVEEIGSARIYTQLSQAQSRCTFFARHGKGFKEQAPVIVELQALAVRVIDQAERINQVNQKKRKEALEKDVLRKAQDLRDAQAELSRAQEKVRRLKGEPVVRVHGNDCGCKSCVGM